MIRYLSAFLFIFFSAQVLIGQASDFVTKWDLSKPGTAGNNSISFFTTNAAGSISYTWQEISPGSSSGSGSFSAGTAVSRSITGLPTNVLIELRISTTNLQRFYTNGTADPSRLIDVTQWGSSEWISMENMFRGCDNLNITSTDLPNLTKATSMSSMFHSCATLNGPTNIVNWNTENITSMQGTFTNCPSFNQNIGNWNTANVTDMATMFFYATAFNQNIGNWNTANVTDMAAMFFYATAFNQNIGNWNTANVTNMSAMFQQAAAFNQNIGNWNTANATHMSSMFNGASAFNQNIGDWNTANVLDFTFMFMQASAFNQNIGNWNTANATTMFGMFSGATAFNQNIGNWNTANATNMAYLFSSATAFNQNLGNWQLSNSVDIRYMLDNCGMNCENYSLTLAGWANTTTATGRALGASGRTYGTNATPFRNILTSSKGWTITGDAVSAGTCGPAVFYSKSTGNLDDLATWGTNTNGSGTNPSNFTNANQLFLIRNRSTAGIASSWTVSGTNSMVIVGDASTAITVSTGTNTISGNFRLTNNATLEIGSNSTGLNLNCENGSTVNYNGSGTQDIAPGNYFNLTISNNRGGATLTLAPGYIEVRNTFTQSATNIGSWTHAGNTLVYCGSGSQTIAALDYNNLIISGVRTGTPTITLASGTTRVYGNAFLSSFGAINWINAGNTVEYVGSAGQQIGAYYYNNLSISGNKNNGNFTLEYGTVADANTVSVTATNISGWINNGNTFNYNGSSAQTVAPEIVYRNLTISGSNTKTLGGNTVVQGDLTLSSNKLILDAYNLTLSGIVNGAGSSNYVQTNGVGTLKKNLINTAAFAFPVGNSAYNPVTITNNTGTADLFSVRVQDAVYLNGLSGTILSTPRVDRTWQIDKTNPTANAGSGVNFDFQWSLSEETGGISTYQLIHHNGSVWAFANGTGAQTVSGTNPKTLRFTQYTGGFSPFAITDGLGSLPVNWLSFTGEHINDRVQLNWSTASEQNSSHFEIERSANGIEFANIGRVTAAGNSQSISNYEHQDDQPLNGVSYYRLRQVDQNGNYSFSRVLQLKYQTTTAARIIPNPTHGPINLQIPSDWTGTYDCRVFNALGVLTENRRGLRAGSHAIDLSKNAPGVYQITLWANGQQIEHQRVMKQ